jgi:RimJ/RimL family protein N-acetyltransferase
MPGPVFRSGEMVQLRTVEPEDKEFLQRLVNDPRVRHDIMSTEPVNGPQEQGWIESTGEHEDTTLLVCTEGKPAGTVTLKPPNEAWGTAEVGYMIAPEEWNNGYATDAVRELCGYAFEERRLDKVYATVYTTNEGSQRVLEKVGFSEEGVFRKEAFVEGERVDVHRYGLLAAEWDGGVSDHETTLA